MKVLALAHFPSGVFSANAAWLVLACVSFNLTRDAGTLAGGAPGKAVTLTVRHKFINAATKVSTSGRHIAIHLSEHWPWQEAWTKLFTSACNPPGHTAF